MTQQEHIEGIVALARNRITYGMDRRDAIVKSLADWNHYNPDSQVTLEELLDLLRYPETS
jgi:hypothetical protein